MHPSSSHEMASSPCPSCSAVGAVCIFTTTYKGRSWHLARCRHCDQQYTDPQPSLEDIRSFYNDDYHSDLCTEPQEQAGFRHKFQGYADWICAHIHPGGRSLDIGCTTGLFPLVLQSRGFAAEGLEINTATARWGEQHFGIPIRNEPFELADYPEQVFSLVSLADVLEHCFNPADTLGRVHRILREGAHAFVSFPDIASIESRYYRTLALATGRNWVWSTCHVPLHTWEFTRSTAMALFHRAGFRVTAFRRSHLGSTDRSSLPLKVLTAPPQLLSFQPLAEKLGTQMEFLLQKA